MQNSKVNYYFSRGANRMGACCLVASLVIHEKTTQQYGLTQFTINRREGFYLKCNLGCIFSSKENYSCTILIKKIYILDEDGESLP